MANCEACGLEMEERRATERRPYQYSLSGLKNVYLIGIDVEQCPDCRVELPIIPRMAQLHNVIRKILVNKQSLLTGDEIRFLRKNAGFSAKMFAAMLHVTASHLSRIENGKYLLSAQGDKLIRAIISAAADQDRLQEILLEQKAKARHSKNGAAKKNRRLFRLQGNQWRSAA